jgi:hypothetical protein
MIETNINQNEQSDSNIDPVLSSSFFYLDLADEGFWLIKDKNGKRYTAGYDKDKVVNLINRLNEAHRPNIEQGAMNEIYVCWNNHDKGYKCDFEREI